MPGGISIHCVDVARGKIAVGLAVALVRLDGVPIANGRIRPNGVLDDAALCGDLVIAGGYEVTFKVGDFYRASGVEIPSPAFLEDVPYRFHIADVAQHYHLPFKFTPWGFSLFRGGA